MDEKDPVFYITDLLIHMAQDQMKKTLAEGVTGEQPRLSSAPILTTTKR